MEVRGFFQHTPSPTQPPKGHPEGLFDRTPPVWPVWEESAWPASSTFSSESGSKYPDNNYCVYKNLATGPVRDCETNATALSSSCRPMPEMDGGKRNDTTAEMLK